MCQNFCMSAVTKLCSNMVVSNETRQIEILQSFQHDNFTENSDCYIKPN